MFKSLLENLNSAEGISPLVLPRLQDCCIFFEEKTPQLLIDLEKVKEKFTYENLDRVRRKGSPETHLEFWRGSGDYGIAPALNDHDVDDEFGVILNNFLDEVSSKLDFWTGNDSLSEAMEDYLFETFHTYASRIFHSWFGFLWQEVNGFETGAPAKIIENNSTRMYYLNDFRFDRNSIYDDLYFDKRIKATPFNRKLSLEEIFLRSGERFRLHYLNNWQYYEKKEEFIEIGMHGNITIINSGKLSGYKSKNKLEEKKHSSSLNFDNSHEVATKYYLKKANEFINEGWIQKFRPNHFTKKIFDEAINCKMRPKRNKESNFIRCKEKEILLFEHSNFKLPKYYRIWLYLFNGEPSSLLESYRLFHENKIVGVINKFYSLNEIQKIEDFIEIGTFNDTSKICISSTGDGVFKKMKNEQITKVANTFEYFLINLF